MLLRRALLYGQIAIDPLYQAVLDYATANSIPLPDATLQAKQNAYAVALRSAGLLDKWDVKYVFACHDRDFAKINWMNPGTYNCTENGTLVFTSNVGFRSNGTTGYLNSGWRPILDGPLYTRNDCSVSYFVENDDNTGGMNEYGVSTASLNQSMFANTRSAANLFNARINDSTNINYVNTPSIGRYCNQRTASNARQTYKDGVERDSDTTASTVLGNSGNMFICANNINGTAGNFSIKNISDLSAGASLGLLAVDDSDLWYDYFNSL
jgi:hypothetical protein